VARGHAPPPPRTSYKMNIGLVNSFFATYSLSDSIKMNTLNVEKKVSEKLKFS